MGSEGRRSAAYRKTSALFKTGQFPCWLQLPGCTGIGTTVDHYPPLRGADEHAWKAAGGTYRPACRTCQCAQGGTLRTREHNKWTW